MYSLTSARPEDERILKHKCSIFTALQEKIVKVKRNGHLTFWTFHGPAFEDSVFQNGL